MLCHGLTQTESLLTNWRYHIPHSLALPQCALERACHPLRQQNPILDAFPNREEDPVYYFRVLALTGKPDPRSIALHFPVTPHTSTSSDLPHVPSWSPPAKTGTVTTVWSLITTLSVPFFHLLFNPPSFHLPPGRVFAS